MIIKTGTLSGAYNENIACKLTPLICIKDFGFAMFLNGLRQHLRTPFGGHCIRERPVKDVAIMQIDDRH